MANYCFFALFLLFCTVKCEWMCGYDDDLNRKNSELYISNTCSPDTKDLVNKCCIGYDKCFEEKKGHKKCDRTYCLCLQRSVASDTKLCEGTASYLCGVAEQFGEKFYNYRFGLRKDPPGLEEQPSGFGKFGSRSDGQWNNVDLYAMMRDSDHKTKSKSSEPQSELAKSNVSKSNSTETTVSAHSNEMKSNELATEVPKKKSTIDLGKVLSTNSAKLRETTATEGTTNDGSEEIVEQKVQKRRKTSAKKHKKGKKNEKSKKMKKAKATADVEELAEGDGKDLTVLREEIAKLEAVAAQMEKQKQKDAEESNVDLEDENETNSDENEQTEKESKEESEEEDEEITH